MRHKIALPLLALLLCLSACGTLDKTGPYQGDKFLYDTDLMIASSYDAVHTFVVWEYQNRATLAAFPHIKIKADEIRAQAPGAFKAALMLRDTYAATPTSGTKSALESTINILRTMTSVALSYMSQYSSSGTGLNPITPPMP